MPWIKAKDRMPAVELSVTCRLKHCLTGAIQEHQLVAVDEDDCSWRTADDRCEIDFSWDVIEWFEVELD